MPLLIQEGHFVRMNEDALRVCPLIYLPRKLAPHFAPPTARKVAFSKSGILTGIIQSCISMNKIQVLKESNKN